MLQGCLNYASVKIPWLLQAGLEVIKCQTNNRIGYSIGADSQTVIFTV